MVNSYANVYDAREEVFALLTQILRMRPRAIGVVEVGDGGYGLKVSLPEVPATAPPDELGGVALRYDLVESPATLLGSSRAASTSEVPDWRRRIRASGI